MAIQIFSTQNVSAGGQKILVQGGAGVGKTPLAATLSPYSPIIFAAETGLLSLSQYNLPYIPIRNEKELSEAWAWLNSSSEAKQFGSLVVDSMSELVDVEVDIAKNKSNASKDQRANYWDVMEDMLSWGRKFQNLQGKHVYVIAKEFYEKDEASGIMKWFPLIGPKSLGPKFSFIFDCVFRMKRDIVQGGGTNSYLQCQPTIDCSCRVRDPRNLIQLYEAADLGAIIQKLQ